MSEKLQFLRTSVGSTALFSAQDNGLNLTLCEIGIGAGRYAPDGSEEALSQQKERVPIAAYERILPNILRMTIALSPLDPEIPQYNFSEFGVYDEDGVLFGIYSHPVNIITTRTHSAGLAFTVDFEVSDVPFDSISVEAAGPIISPLIAGPLAANATAAITALHLSLKNQLEILKIKETAQ